MIDPQLADRYEHALLLLDLSARGLELGPLDRPIASKDAYDVLYVDHADTIELRRKYADHELVGEIHEVDVAWTGSLVDVIPRERPIRWMIASHVIEHVPDIAAWLRELAAVLEPGGVLSLVVPDHRYCFDANRLPSRPGEILAAAVERRTRPSAAQLVESGSLTLQVDTAAIWRGQSDHVARVPDWRHGYESARAASRSDDYVDCHCWTFTPATFVAALEAMTAAGVLAEWELLWIRDTQPGTLEFQAKLRRLPSELDDVERLERQREGLNLAAAVLERSDTGPESDGTALVELSRLERRMIALKRSAMGWCRAVRGGSLLRGLARHRTG